MNGQYQPAPPEEQAAETRLAEIRANLQLQTAAEWRDALHNAYLVDVPWLLDEIDRLHAELVAERARNAPLRVRIKAVRDQADQEQSALLKERERLLRSVEFGRGQMIRNYRLFAEEERQHKATRAELQASREREAAIRRALSQVHGGLRLVDRGVMEWTDAKRVDLAIDRLEALLAAPEPASQEVTGDA